MPRIHLLLSLVATLAIALVSPSLAAAEPSSASDSATVDLAPSFETGDVSRYSFSTSVRQTASMPVRPPATVQAIAIDATLRIEVASTTPESTRLLLVYERLGANFESPARSLQFDSAWGPDRDAGNMWAAPVRSIIGRSIPVEVGPHGEILSFEPPESDLTDPTQAELVRQLVNEETLRQLCQALYGLKTDPSSAGVGEEWRLEDSMPSVSGTMEMTRIFTLDRVHDERAIISIGGTVISRMDEAALQQNPNLRNIAWHEGEVAGSAVWRLDESRLEQFETTITASMTNNSPEYGQNPLTLTIESRSALTLLP